MKVLVLGATGNIGGHILAEALTRGHELTVLIREASKAETLPSGVKAVVGDIDTLDANGDLLSQQDVVIAAVRPPQGQETLLVEMTDKLLKVTDKHKVRLVLSGGAGGLLSPKADQRRLIDDPDYVGPGWKEIAIACAEQLTHCQDSGFSHWTYLAPAAFIGGTEKLGQFRIGTDTLVTDEKGQSKISLPDLATALIDEVEVPQFNGACFTVAY
ncbi:NAD(P)-dependent oxidoreductase [Marinobacterium arenosum]|uniref:NAD(P)-dependent oxidoreductase n=1 Tax=Marinobacterium arenosum TaxID=2862496 RepID=UPI001C97D731|nr:NAD(P)H-binding protein [Marinobacterium arenosum]MBY4676316.1 NAD(P)H-binding protein [Marinobacterium arenosum]